MARKTRIMYILRSFPQISQTYIRAEIEALKNDYDIAVICRKKPKFSYTPHHPFLLLPTEEEIEKEIRRFKPDILHTHWFFNACTVGKLSQKTGIPFTLRAHSFDAMPYPGKYFPKGYVRDLLRCVKNKKFSLLKKALQKIGMQVHLLEAQPYIHSDLCLGVLIFPHTRNYLEKTGISSSKMHDCYPVIDYKAFYDRSPNGKDIMNVGACLPKKKMQDFITLGEKIKNKKFRMYAMGYTIDKMKKLNDRKGKPVEIIDPIMPDDMPKEYKKHEWLVYTARAFDCVGWPVAVAEAQAAGVGVCIAHIRPDIKKFVGDAGFVYDAIEEVAEIISKPCPEEIREKGFEHAKKYDIESHKHILTDLWK